METMYFLFVSTKTWVARNKTQLWGANMCLLFSNVKESHLFLFKHISNCTPLLSFTYGWQIMIKNRLNRCYYCPLRTSWCWSHCPPGFHPPPLLRRFWSVSGGVLSQFVLKPTKKWPRSSIGWCRLIGSLELCVPSSSTPPRHKQAASVQQMLDKHLCHGIHIHIW